MNDAPQPQSQRPRPCPICGGERVLTRCGGYMSLAIGTFSGVRLNAIACTNCGYTELFAEDPQKLRRLLQ